MNAEELLRYYERVADSPDAVARLRRFVLELAVRGKLLPQFPGDEQSVYLLAIAGNASSTGNSIPRGWVCATVGQLLDFKYGKGLASSDRSTSGPTPVFGSNGVVGFTTTPLTAKPSIIVGRKGSAGVLNICDGPSWTTDVAYYIEPPPFFQHRYLYLALSALGLDALGKGVKPGLSRTDAYELAIWVPPLAEQHRIVAKVDELIVLCDRLEAARAEREAVRDRLAAASLARLSAPDPETFREDARFALRVLSQISSRVQLVDQLRQTILTLAVRGKLTASPGASKSSAETSGCDASAEQIPAHWRWARAEEICEAIVDCPHSTPAFVPSGVVCLDTNAFKGGAIIPAKVRYVTEESYRERVKRLAPRSGDVVFAREGSVGESVIVPVGMLCCLGQRVMLFRPSGLVDSRYFQLAISEPGSLARLLALHKGIGAKHVNVADMRKALIPLPPLDEQLAIVAKVAVLTTLCASLASSLAQAEDTRRRLLEAQLRDALEMRQADEEAV